MAIIDVDISEETKTRYLTYALSVVSSRALPDVRDGLKPVQRRILYAMQNNLHLGPDKNHRKSAAVVGEVLARYHPHGDSACYDAMVRMAQDFSLRYPLVDGQGNFGSLDGDSAAAYRYTEAKLTKFALEVIGDIGQETVALRDNFDQTVKEPVVLPSRVPNLLINGSTGIAVGMATAIPPHNLTEVIKALLKLIEDEDITTSKILTYIKGPDFPTGCQIMNSKKELAEIYKSGRGAIRMRAGHSIEKEKPNKKLVVINSIPYSIDKSVLIEKIADFIISKKLPQIVDIRDESTTDVRIVMELAKGADEKNALAFLYKNTTLQQNFNVNLTTLIPTKNEFVGKPQQLSLLEILNQFINFRVRVTKAKLTYEKTKLEQRVHLLEGLEMILDVLDEVIKIVRKSEGRSDASAKLQKKYKLTELQANFIVDLRIYQLSRTSVFEVTSELKEKRKRISEIDKILKSKKKIKAEISKDLLRIQKEFGDKRRCKIVSEYEEPVYDKDSFVQHEDVFVIVTQDGWLKRIRSSNDPSSTRIREGDKILFALQASTKDTLMLFSSKGTSFGCSVHDLSTTSGYGEPVQKLFKFSDGETITHAMILPKKTEKEKASKDKLIFATENGYGFKFPVAQLGQTNKAGKKVAKPKAGDRLSKVFLEDRRFILCISEQSYGVLFSKDEIPELTGPGRGVIMSKLPSEDKILTVLTIDKGDSIEIEPVKGKVQRLSFSKITSTGRAKRGLKLLKRGQIKSVKRVVKGSKVNLSLFD